MSGAGGFLGTFLERIGGMLVRPRRTLSNVLASTEGGLGDVALLLLLHLLAGATRVGSHDADSSLLVARGLLFLSRLEPMMAVQSMLQAVSRLLPDILAIAIGSVALALFGGRRSGGRELDAAAMAWVPAVAVKTVAALAFSALGRDPSAGAQQVIDLVGLAWSAGCWALCLWLMRAERERVVEAR